MNYIDRPHHLEEVSFNQSGYALVRQIDTPKETVRNLIWRPNWGSLTDAIKLMEIIYCTEVIDLIFRREISNIYKLLNRKLKGKRILQLLGDRSPSLEYPNPSLVI